VSWESEESKQTCPRLVAHPGELKVNNTGNNTFELNVAWGDARKKYTDYYDSLADMWTTWNQQFIQADYPRLFIRFEDNLFHAEKVMEKIAECIGQTPKTQPYQYTLERAKNHGRSSNFLAALGKYGKATGRENGLLAGDLKYAETALDPELLRIFHYSIPPTTSSTPRERTHTTRGMGTRIPRGMQQAKHR
jgi:hypothetical protein